MQPSTRPIASASRARASRSDMFRPKLPLDPFADMHPDLREPWSLVPECLWSLTSLQERHVLLVIGAPTLKDLEPLLHSQQLAHSIVILATHEPPPDIPPTVQPAVRIIRLSSPLAIEDAGAVRFVNTLERAERVARIWRKKGGSGVVELPENSDHDTGVLSPPPSVFRFHSRSTQSSPNASVEHLPAARPRSLSARTLTKMRGSALPAVDPFQRPFDALFNFMPASVPDKLLLKQTILVTTISHPFLSSSGASRRHSPPIRPSASGNSSRSSVYSRVSLSNHSSFTSPPATPTFNQSRASFVSVNGVEASTTKAHVCHVLPPAHTPKAGRVPSKLVQGIESFLLSFGYPTRPDKLERAVPYLVAPTTLSDQVSLSTHDGALFEWSLAEIMVNGLLDSEDGDSTGSQSQHTHITDDHTGYIAANQSHKAPRAWLIGSRDVVVQKEELMIAPVLPASPAPVRPGKERLGARRGGTGDENAPSSTSSSLQHTPPPTPPLATSRNLSPTPELFAAPATYRGREGKQREHLHLAPSSFNSGLPTPPHSEESTVDSDSGGRLTIELGRATQGFEGQQPLPRKKSASGSSFRKRVSNFRTKGVEDEGNKPSSSSPIRWKFWGSSRSASVS